MCEQILFKVCVQKDIPNRWDPFKVCSMYYLQHVLFAEESCGSVWINIYIFYQSMSDVGFNSSHICLNKTLFSEKRFVCKRGSVELTYPLLWSTCTKVLRIIRWIISVVVIVFIILTPGHFRNTCLCPSRFWACILSINLTGLYFHDRLRSG